VDRNSPGTSHVLGRVDADHRNLRRGYGSGGRRHLRSGTSMPLWDGGVHPIACEWSPEGQRARPRAAPTPVASSRSASAPSVHSLNVGMTATGGNGDTAQLVYQGRTPVAVSQAGLGV